MLFAKPVAIGKSVDFTVIIAEEAQYYWFLSSLF